MKHISSLYGWFAAASLMLIPVQAQASGISNHFLAESSFTQSVTQSVKEGYQDIKTGVTETFEELTGDSKSDTQKFRERREKDLKRYRKEIRDAQQDYLHKREKAQREYLKRYGHLPLQEDLHKDLETTPVR